MKHMELNITTSLISALGLFEITIETRPESDSNASFFGEVDLPKIDPS